MLHQSSTLKLLIAIVYQTLKKYLEIWELKKYKSLGLIKESSLWCEDMAIRAPEI
jgi:hypothetical protein